MGNRKTFIAVCIAMIIFGAVTVSLDMEKRYAQIIGFFYLIALIAFLLLVVVLVVHRTGQTIGNQKRVSESNLKELQQAAHETKK